MRGHEVSAGSCSVYAKGNKIKALRRVSCMRCDKILLDGYFFYEKEIALSGYRLINDNFTNE